MIARYKHQYVWWFLLLVSFSQNAISTDIEKLADRVANFDTTVVEDLKKFSKNGNEVAALLLGLLYYDGVMVKKSDKESLFYLSLIKEDRRLLGEKYALLFFLYTDKEEYDSDYIGTLVFRAAEYDYAYAEFLLGNYFFAINRNSDLAIKHLKSAMKKDNGYRLSQELATTLYIIERATRSEISILKNEYDDLLKSLQYSSHPAKYVAYMLLVQEGIIVGENSVFEVNELLAQDIGYDDKNYKPPLNLSTELKQDALHYLEERKQYYKEAKLKPELYGYCTKYSKAKHNKCLRLVYVIFGYCEWPGVLKESMSSHFNSSEYHGRCLDKNFRELNQNIKEW